jgi:CBS domain-containing protein
VTRLDKAYDSLHALFGRAVVVAHLMEDLITSPRAAGLEAAAARMSEARIDVVGATDETPQGVRVVGYFSRAGFTPFADHDVMPATSSLKDALAALRAKERVFVRDAANGGDVVGIVTRADLQKPPFRLYCFGLITLLEMHLLQLIRAEYANDDDAACALLTAERAQECRGKFEERKRKGLDIGIADCLQLGDKFTIISKAKDMRARIGFGGNEWRRFAGDVRDLRDDLAHGQLLDGGREWTDVIERMLEIEALLDTSLKGAR